MKSENGLRILAGSFILLVVSYLIYFVRYPMWQFFSIVEPIFFLSFLSYFIVFIIALLLLKKDLKKSLGEVFKNKDSWMTFLGIFFGLLYFAFWYLASSILGSQLELTSFPNLRGYESYVVYSFPLAFSLYLLFSVFGAFAEEVTYRGYVQTRISSRFGNVAGVLVATIFFSLQHIHVFQPGWVSQFLQRQLLHVVLFGIFVGYLFLKSEENLWSVFSFHAVLNVFSVSVPIVVNHIFPFTYYVAETASFAALILLLSYLSLKKKQMNYG